MFEGVLPTLLVTYLGGNLCASDSNFCLSFILEDSFNLIPRGFWFELYKRQRVQNIISLVIPMSFLCPYFKIHDKTWTKNRNTFSKFTSFNIFQTVESDGALFQRSENNRNLIYGTYIGGGESKTYSSVKSSMPYGPLVYINKEECRAHITKGMGTGIRTIVKKHKSMSCMSISKKWTTIHFTPPPS